jgi:transposase
MSIDDKAIGHEGFSILSNGETGKIAMMIESCKSVEVSQAISLFGTELNKVESISCDMSACYINVCSEELPRAKIVIDKFHVMQYVYDAVLDRAIRAIEQRQRKNRTRQGNTQKIGCTKTLPLPPDTIT